MSEPDKPKTLHLLLVEDDEADRLSIKHAIDSVNSPGRIEVEEVTNLQAARTLLQERPFDCALVDDSVPDGSALTLLRDAKFSGTAIPIIVLTRLDDQTAAASALQEGAEDYLLKADITGALLMRSIWYAIERFRFKSELERANLQLERLAFLDPLVEVLNRRGLEHILPGELTRAAREGRPLFAVFLDCDNFKNVNDNCGYGSGDVVLKELCRRIRASVRHSDHVARIGGDEFLILLPGAKAGEAILLAERVRKAVSETPIITSGGTQIKQTVTLGVFSIPYNARSVASLLAYTPFLLRASKQGGKNRVTLAEVDDFETAADSIEMALLSVCNGQALSVFSQPIVRLNDQAQVGMEFLIRGPKGVLERPEELFARSLQKGILTSVDLQCFQKCVEVSNRRDGEISHINLCWPTLAQTDAEELLSMLPANRSLDSYCVGFSAQQIVGDPYKQVPYLAALRKGGLRVALDEVNFGGSSLEALMVLHPDIIKIDKTIVTGGTHDSHKMRALERLIRAAKALDIEPFVVGVESAAEVEALRKMGVRYGQGFLWGKPVPVSGSLLPH
jgi:diguanylate cyclase (GGDEF)-like protein